jgi:hypothetical protein
MAGVLIDVLRQANEDAGGVVPYTGMHFHMHISPWPMALAACRSLMAGLHCTCSFTDSPPCRILPVRLPALRRIS